MTAKLLNWFKSWLTDERVFSMSLNVKAISKERPRVSARGGRPYTPAKTRNYEAYIAAKGRLVGIRFLCPVAVTIEITEAMPKSFSQAEKELSVAGLKLPSRGDLDNKVKAITDGLNGVAYIDDDQIVRLSASKEYGERDTIDITIVPAGLTNVQLQTAVWYLRNPKRGQEELNKSSAGMG